MIANLFLTNLVLFIFVFLLLVLIGVLNDKDWDFPTIINIPTTIWMWLTIFSIPAYIIYFIWQ
jgi:hypothetical protein